MATHCVTNPLLDRFVNRYPMYLHWSLIEEVAGLIIAAIDEIDFDASTRPVTVIVACGERSIPIGDTAIHFIDAALMEGFADRADQTRPQVIYVALREEWQPGHPLWPLTAEVIVKKATTPSTLLR